MERYNRLRYYIKGRDGMTEIESPRDEDTSLYNRIIYVVSPSIGRLSIMRWQTITDDDGVLHTGFFLEPTHEFGCQTKEAESRIAEILNSS